MSTDVARRGAEVPVTRFAWQPKTASTSAVAVRPLITGTPEDRTYLDSTHELVLPSVIGQRAASAEREGHDRGFREGERAGQESARLRAEGMFARLTATIDQVASLRTGMLRRSEEDVVRLAVAIAERILRREVRVNRQLLVTMAQDAARRLGDATIVTIQMHPDDYLATASGRSSASDCGPVRLTADPNVAPGGCLVQSAFGTIDVGLDAQIREVLRSLLGEDPEPTPDAAQR